MNKDQYKAEIDTLLKLNPIAKKRIGYAITDRLVRKSYPSNNIVSKVALLASVIVIVIGIVGGMHIYSNMKHPITIEPAPNNSVVAPIVTVTTDNKTATNDTNQTNNTPINMSKNTNSVPSTNKDLSATTKSSSSSVPVDNGKWIFNNIHTMTARKVALPPSEKRNETWTFKKYKEFINFNPKPNYLPERLINALQCKDSDTKDLYFEKDGSLTPGYYGGWSFSASDNSNSYIKINVSNTKVYTTDCIYMDTNVKTQSIEGINSVLGRYSPKESTIYYTAKFKINSIEFYLESKGLTEEEFIKVIKSIIV
ncbi:MAG: hypothetical protein PHV32_05380 [Eubacteriales bacterium]|nr:hypothetical protein [Oscillospiraceae bacterium]MDD4493766.1 hypothetical protein [Eubacteriales bacterium]